MRRVFLLSVLEDAAHCDSVECGSEPFLLGVHIGPAQPWYTLTLSAKPRMLVDYELEAPSSRQRGFVLLYSQRSWASRVL